MNAFLWILQIVLGAAFLMAGAAKLQPKEKLFERMAWVEEFDGTQLKGIAIVEVVGALGLVLPGLLDIVPGITPWAALGLALTMALAAALHIRRKEYVPEMMINVVLGVLSLVVVWGRFGDYAF